MNKPRKDYVTIQTGGSLQVGRKMQLYNLDMILVLKGGCHAA